MIINDLTQIGKIYLLLAKEWTNARLYITVKDNEEKPFNKVLVDSPLKANTIYRYLLKHWQNIPKLQIFCTDKKP